MFCFYFVLLCSHYIGLLVGLHWWLMQSSISSLILAASVYSVLFRDWIAVLSTALICRINTKRLHFPKQVFGKYFTYQNVYFCFSHIVTFFFFLNSGNQTQNLVHCRPPVLCICSANSFFFVLFFVFYYETGSLSRGWPWTYSLVQACLVILSSLTYTAE